MRNLVFVFLPRISPTISVVEILVWTFHVLGIPKFSEMFSKTFRYSLVSETLIILHLTCEALDSTASAFGIRGIGFR